MPRWKDPDSLALLPKLCEPSQGLVDARILERSAPLSGGLPGDSGALHLRNQGRPIFSDRESIRVKEDVKILRSGPALLDQTAGWLFMLVGMGLHNLDRSAHNYGLSLIMGGGESTLWELTGAYASMARVVLRFSGSDGALEGAVHAPSVLKASTRDDPTRPPLNAASLYHTLMALQEVNRPEAESGWFRFAGTERIAWKTGTSYGHRDAWAIGVTGCGNEYGGSSAQAEPPPATASNKPGNLFKKLRPRIASIPSPPTLHPSQGTATWAAPPAKPSKPQLHWGQAPS